MNHGEVGLILHDQGREDGLLVSVNAAGEELRLHPSGVPGTWEIREWRIWGVDGVTWMGPFRPMLTPDQWIACGRVFQDRADSTALTASASVL